jgi:hypothetical protein
MTFASRWYQNTERPDNIITVDDPQVVTVAGVPMVAKLFPVASKADTVIPAGVQTVESKNFTYGIITASAQRFNFVIKDVTFGSLDNPAIDDLFVVAPAVAGVGIFNRLPDAWVCDNGVPCSSSSPCQVWNCVGGGAPCTGTGDICQVWECNGEDNCTGTGNICQVWECLEDDDDCEDGALGTGCTICDFVDSDVCGEVDDECGNIDDAACEYVQVLGTELTFAEILAFVMVEFNGGVATSLVLTDGEMILEADLDSSDNAEVRNITIWISDAAPFAIAGAELEFTLALVAISA